MNVQANSHLASADSVEPIGIGGRRATDQRAARRRVRGWLLAGLLAVAAVLGLAPAAFAQDIIHVTPTGSDSANGSDWTTNATSLQHALSIATNGDEIWVASGVYTPGLTKTATFTVTSGIQLYGGFATTETVRTQRDWVANPTILSGDIGGDDITVGNVVTTATNITGTNAYHVLWLDGENGDPITTTTRIDGFTITAGNAGGGGEGGGLYCLGRGSGNACSPSIANVLFSGNSASDGGAMFCIGTNGGASSPSLVNVTFNGNSAGYDGGAMLSTGEYGGASSPSLVNVTFSGNLAGYSGGAMYNNGYGDGGVSSPSLVNVTFSGNSAGRSGGAMYNAGGLRGVGSPSLFNVTFSSNSAGDDGGAMYNRAANDGVSSPSLASVRFSGNSARDGGAMYNYGGVSGVSSPSLANVTFSSNLASGNGGAMYNVGYFNGSWYDPGGVSSPSLVNVTFSGNSAGSDGGAMYNYGLPWVVSSPSLVNVLLWGNSAANGSDHLYNYLAVKPVISNTLIPSNTADFDSFLAGTIWGAGNITDTSAYTTADIFVDAANGDLHLAGGSPAIDAGDDAAVPAGVTTDLDGNRRIQGAAVDMGAYESTPLAPDVTLVKTVAPDTEVVFGGTVTYTLVLVNNGTLSDSSVTLTDTLPAGAGFAGWVEQPAGATFSGGALAWNGAVGQAEVITFTFAATNTVGGGATISNTAWFSGSAQAGTAAAAYMTSSTLYPSGSGNWSEVYPPCSGVCTYVVPAGFTITLDLDISLAGGFEIETGGTFIPNGKTVTLIGDQAQTLTGNRVTFYDLVVNKTNKTDTVTIDGKLKVSRKLTVRSGKLVSASDYGDIEIEDQGELELTNDITVSGHFTMTGDATFTPNTYAVIFDGATEQNVAWEYYASFWNLTVMTGTTLIEVNPGYNVGVENELTNYGTIRKTQSVDGPDSFIFGLAGYYPEGAGGYEMEIAVTDRSGADPLTAIRVDRIDTNHPNAPGGATTDIYWTITPSGTNYVATVVLPQNALASPGACRYSGVVWSCDRSSFDSDIDLTVTRTGVTAFSDWAVFETQATTTTLATSGSPVEVDTLVTFTATVEPSSVPGSVAFFADGASLGSVDVTAGEAQTNTAGLLIGTHVITATFTPTGLFLPSNGTLAGGQEITCAATRTVTNDGDSGAGSLRQAIADVCAGGTVNFSLSYPATITLTSGVALTLTKDVTITGPGADKVAVSGNAATRVFVVDRYVSVSIDGLTIRDGRTGGDGGGILVLDSGQLSMINSTFTANQANNGGALSVERSSPGLINVTFSGNSATNRGGAMYSVAYDNSCCTYLRNVIFSGNSAALGGAMYNYGNGGSNSPSLENVTFSGNSASQGGAMFNYGTSGGVSSPSLINVTFVGNSATSRGGAMYNNGGGGSSSPSLVNVILWGNTATTAGAQLFNVSAAPIISFTLVPSSTADIAVSSSTITWGPGNITSGGDALLGALGDYGGDTQTMPLLPGSPAIDAGDATACPDTDQRGATRPVGDGCDMGAFERQGFTLSKGTGDSQSAAWGMAFGAPITVAVSSTFTEPVDGGQVTFAGPLSGAGTAPITGTATITGGVAIFTPTANSTAGSYNVTGSAAGASPAISFGLTNTQRASAMTLVAAPNPSIIRQAVTFTSTVTDSVGSALPTGVVTFTVNGAEVAATLANGVATYVTDTLAAAGHVITATYGGDAGFTGSTDNLTQVVNRAATSTALAGAPNPSVYGQAVTYTATVTATAPGVGLPTGIVTFMDGTTALGTGTLDESGVATYTTSSLISGPPGTPGQPHPITAAYGGDGSFAGSTSAAVDQVVNQAATTTTLVSSRNPSTYGDNIVFTATVSVQTPGAASMTGEVVIFKDGATTLGTGTLDAGGVATYTTSLLSVGVYSMTADFAGTSNLLGSTSTEVAQLIAKAAQTITFDTIADKQISAAPFTVTATASSRLTVTFTSGTPAVCTVSESTVSLVNNGACTIYATQPGDHNYLAATPVGRSFNVVGKHGTATSLATAPNPAQAGVTIVITATVEKQVSILTVAQPADPSGQVQFRVAGGDVLGTAGLVGNTAVFTKNDFARGVYTIVAEYLGDVNFSSSTSNGVQQIVSPPLTARNDAAGTLQGVAVQIDPLANDLDPAGGGLVVAAVTQPASGSVAIDGGAKTVTFTPDPAFTGLVTFTYTARDIYGITDEALVAVVVSAVDQAGHAPQIGVIDNEAGSTHDFDSGRFQTQVQVPAGSYPTLLGDKEIFYLAYTPVITPTGDVTRPPGSFSFAGMVFHLSAFLNGTDLGHYEFPQPVTLVISYDPALLGGLSEQLLTPFYWNGTAWAKDGLSILHIDTTAHRITFQIWHLSEYALFSRPPLNTPSYLFLPAVTNRSDPAAVMEAAEGAAPDAPEPAPAPDVDAPVDEPVPEEAASPVPDTEEMATPDAAAESTDQTEAQASEPAPEEAAPRLHLPLITR